MITTIEAIYENGFLKLPLALPLPDKTRVRVTIQSGELDQDTERDTWLTLSEEALTRTWDNPSDDIFNELDSFSPSAAKSLHSW